MATEPSRQVKPKKIIGIDLMGSDNAPSALLDAISSLTPSLSSDIQLVTIGAPACKKQASSLPFYPATEVIGMDEDPLFALRTKKDSSISVGMHLLKEGKIDAFVSAGNTGALVSSAKMTLGTFSKLKRPALLALLPTKKGAVAVLDVGANAREELSYLVQFAQLGAAYQKIRGAQRPRVGLLNIGSEASKGTTAIRQAYATLNDLKNPSFDFIGNVEGKSVFDGEVDVLVADGFTGNIFLKTAEGLASFILDQMQSHFSKERFVHELRERLYYTEYPGALLAGVKGTVIKCHGYATVQSMTRGILGAAEFVSTDFVKKLEKEYGINASS